MLGQAGFRHEFSVCPDGATFEEAAGSSPGMGLEFDGDGGFALVQFRRDVAGDEHYMVELGAFFGVGVRVLDAFFAERPGKQDGVIEERDFV